MITLPPRYVAEPAEEVYDRRLSDELFRTLAQIRGLAYKTKGERTPVLTLEDLMQIRSADRATIYRHLAALRERGYIRTERIGKYQLVIYPLRWELGAALPADDDQNAFTDEEAEALFGDAKICRTDATKNKKSRIGATQHDHDVVLNHDHDREQQQHDSSRTDATDFQDLLEELSGTLAGNGMDETKARALALRLLEGDGRLAVCRRQLDAFERRCEVARASKRGLENPIGLLCHSIEGDWPLPANGTARTEKRWFTDAEEAEFFYHGPVEEEVSA